MILPKKGRLRWLSSSAPASRTCLCLNRQAKKVVGFGCRGDATYHDWHFQSIHREAVAIHPSSDSISRLFVVLFVAQKLVSLRARHRTIRSDMVPHCQRMRSRMLFSAIGSKAIKATIQLVTVSRCARPLGHCRTARCKLSAVVQKKAIRVRCAGYGWKEQKVVTASGSFKKGGE
jgi:hypothetical protein